MPETVASQGKSNFLNCKLLYCEKASFDNLFSCIYWYYYFILVPSQSEISENEENPSRKDTQHNTHTEHTHTFTSAGSKGRADFYYSHDESVLTKDTCSDSIVNSDIKIDSDNSDSEDIVIGDRDQEEVIEDVGNDSGVDNITNPYICDICEKSFVKESNLLGHKDTQHS